MSNRRRLIPSFLLLLFCLLTFWASAQKKDLGGWWEGTITKDLSPGAEVFYFSMYLVQKGNKLEGQTYVKGKDIYALMTVEGKIGSNGEFYFQERRVLDKEVPANNEWCLKNGVLKLQASGKKLIYQGTWDGYTSFTVCKPGKVYLVKSVPRV